MGSDALLLGRKTYEGFAAAWPGRIDEYRLMTFPVVLGKGRRLFGEGSPTTTLQLADSQAVGPDGVLVLTYQRATDS